MNTDKLEKDNWGWQLYQLRQKLGEWWEKQTDRTLDQVPQADYFGWLSHPLTQIIFQIIFWVILTMGISWLVINLIRSGDRLLKQWQNPQFFAKKTGDNMLQISRQDWLKKAQKFQQKGNYREACRCLYMAMLQQLNQAGIIPDQPSRTDGEYLQLIAKLPNSQSYQILILTHQQLCFSKQEITPAIFTQCQQAYQAILAISNRSDKQS